MVQSSGFRAKCSVFSVKSQVLGGLEFEVCFCGFQNYRSKYASITIPGIGVWGLGSRVQGSGFRVWGLGLSVYTFVVSFHESDKAVRIVHLITDSGVRV